MDISATQYNGLRLRPALRGRLILAARSEGKGSLPIKKAKPPTWMKRGF